MPWGGSGISLLSPRVTLRSRRKQIFIFGTRAQNQSASDDWPVYLRLRDRHSAHVLQKVYGALFEHRQSRTGLPSRDRLWFAVVVGDVLTSAQLR